MPPMNMPTSTVGLVISSEKSGVVHLHGFHEGGNDRQRRQRRGADGEALADGGRGIAHLVQAVSDRAGLFAHAGHFGDTTGVVRYRAVGVDRHGDTHGRQHAHRGDADAVQAGQGSGDVDDGGQEQDRQYYRLHTYRQAGDHHRGGPGFTGFGNSSVPACRRCSTR